MLPLSFFALLVTLAQSPEPEPPTTGAPSEIQGTELQDDWQRQYDEARALMLSGSFAEAEARFGALSESAHSRVNRALARENADLCRRWREQGLALRPAGEAAPGVPAREPAPAVPKRLEDRRTIDELALLYTGAVLYGIGSGVTLAFHTEPDSAAGFILPSLGLAGASVGLVALLDSKLELRYGVPQSITSGMMLGLEEGLVWTIWNQARTTSADEWDADTVATIVWGSATLGGIAGGLLASRFGTTPGRVSLIGSSALWTSLATGLLVGAIADGDRADDHAMLSAALALNVGIAAGALLSPQLSPSIGRVRFIDLGALSGALLFGGLYMAMRDNDAGADGLMVSTGLGIITGAATSVYLTRNMEKDYGPHRDPSLLSRLAPTLAPTANGTGMVLGVGGAI